MHKNLIILAAGASSRMKRSLLQNDPSRDVGNINKALIGLGRKNRPLLLYLLEHARKAGYTEITLVVSKEHEAFKSLFGDQMSNNEYQGMKIHFAIQEIPKGRTKPLGTADALLNALEQFPQLKGGTFTICNSDNLYSIESFKALQLDDHKNAMIRYDRNGLSFDQEKISKFAVIEMDDDGFLVDITEKPTSLDNEGSIWVSMNLFKLFGPMAYPYLKDCPIDPVRDEKELPTALLNMCRENPKALYTIPRSEHVPDLTMRQDIYSFSDFLDGQ
jgi:glucose-1-phosphate adenylyltransferase